MFKLSHLQNNAILFSFTALTSLLLLSACQDVKYDYDIPKAASDCTEPDAKFRNGGAGVVDRNGGAGVVDRKGDYVTNYCDYDPCLASEVPIGDIIIKWDPDGGMLSATQSCQ